MQSGDLRTVFVGNIPYDATEQQLTEYFRKTGDVVMFRLMTDRETGKPKGFGFCEYAQASYAQTAVRHLNGKEMYGRSLRVAIATPEQVDESRGGRGEEKRFGPPVVNRPLPSGLEIISKLVETLSRQQLLEILTEMKKFIHQNPEGARQLLLDSPQVAQTLLRILLLFNLVRQNDIQALRPDRPQGVGAPPDIQIKHEVRPGPPTGPPVPGLGRSDFAPMPVGVGVGGPPPLPVPLPMPMPMPMSMPMRPVGPPSGSMPPAPASVPVAAAPLSANQIQNQLSALPPKEQAVLREVMKLSPEQIAQLPQSVQQQVYHLKSQLANVTVNR